MPPLDRSFAARFSPRVRQAYARAATQRGLRIAAATTEQPAEILLYDEIGFFGITARDFVEALAAAGNGPLTLRINSPGGDVFDGLAIYNALKARTSPVSVVVDGLAASAASFIAMAGTTVTMAEQSMLMIHKAWGFTIGNDDDHLAQATLLGKIDGQLASIYANKTGKPDSEMLAAMKSETWLTPEEAKAMGLCDEIAAPTEAAAQAKRLGGVKAAMRAALRAAYDPDGDGDDDAMEAVGLIQDAISSLTEAVKALTGTDDASTEAHRAAATDPEWIVGADRELPTDDKEGWDGPAAAERMLDAAGFNGNSPDPAKAKRGFLVWDHHNPKLKGSYKLPFADVVSGELRAMKSGLDAAASRLPQTDIPDAVRADARGVIDAYEKRYQESAAKANAVRQAHANATASDSRRRRLRLAQAI